MTYIPIKGFAPDLEPTTPGILLDCNDLIPTIKGMQARPSPAPSGLPTLGTEVVGAATLRSLDGTSVTYAGTEGAIFRAGVTAWVEVSRSTSVSYAASFDFAPWRFAQFNDVAYAANKADKLQIQNADSGNFGDISGNIRASLIETVGDFVMLANTSDPLFGESTNRWWCSGIGNGATFAPDLSTQAASGTLSSTSGGILALRRLGNDIVAYKLNSMYLGRYVGPPAIWSWTLVSEEIGAPSQEAVVRANDGHFFLGTQDFYFFDGTRPVPIGAPLKEWFYQNVDKDRLHLVRGYHEFQHSVVWWFFPSVGSPSLDSFLAFNYKTANWGKGQLDVETIVEFVGGGLSYDDFGTKYATWDDAPQVPYGFPPWITNTSFLGYFDTDHILQALTMGLSSGGSLLTGWYGKDGAFIFGHRVRPRFSRAPTNATLINRWQRQLGSSISSASGALTMIDGKFDFERSDRWHSIRIDVPEDFEIVGLDVEARPDGSE